MTEFGEKPPLDNTPKPPSGGKGSGRFSIFETLSRVHLSYKDLKEEFFTPNELRFITITSVIATGFFSAGVKNQWNEGFEIAKLLLLAAGVGLAIYKTYREFRH